MSASCKNDHMLGIFLVMVQCREKVLPQHLYWIQVRTLTRVQSVCIRVRFILSTGFPCRCASGARE
ncbi:hypothetical protein ANANG_G00065890 [Anguilla anguilla]|uniref:Uncharacterized protein n=1 Tax=Anguilla anguilla TaxID=7936 RepID=A0A9D3MPQ0_ANGAN|nr:hypothetical protein ANANG_G00065890 [Anguilla anguilla]